MISSSPKLLFWKRFAQGKLKTYVSSVKVRLPSPNEILSWSQRRLPNSKVIGRLENAHTVEHDTLKPVSGGLFCERIFGPMATNVCSCSRKRGWNESFCPVCLVQFTTTRLRRYQMGYVALATPVIHVWALQGNYLANLLGKKPARIRSIGYGSVMCYAKLGFTSLSLPKVLDNHPLLTTCKANEASGYQKLLGVKHSATIALGINHTKMNLEKEFSFGLKSFKSLVYERGNTLPFLQFLLYKPDTFKRVSQFFDSLNSTPGLQSTVLFMPIPCYGQKVMVTEKGVTRLYGGEAMRGLGAYNRLDFLKWGIRDQYLLKPNSFKSLTVLDKSFLGLRGLQDPSPWQSSTMANFALISLTRRQHMLNKANKLFAFGDTFGRFYRASLMQEPHNNIKIKENKFLSKKFSLLTPSPAAWLTKYTSFASFNDIPVTTRKVSRAAKLSENSYSATNGTAGAATKSNLRNIASLLDASNAFTDGLASNTKGIVFSSFARTNYRTRTRGASLMQAKQTFGAIGAQDKHVQDKHIKESEIQLRLFHRDRRFFYRSQQEINSNIVFTGPWVLFQALKNLNLILLENLVTWKLGRTRVRLETYILQKEMTRKKRALRNKISKGGATLARRKKLIDSFLSTRQLPQWMILSVLPVLPPALRPILQLEPNNVVVSDLNVLYQTVIRRNDALKGLLTFRPLEMDVINRQVSLQQAVERLFDKGAGTRKRPLKALSQGFHGKRGLFRLNMLGKRVDYSGRSVIVVGPTLLLHQCGLPRDMALVLFLPFLIARLKKRRVVHNTSHAKKLILRRDSQIWAHLRALIYEHPVLLNRAPTLHRLGFQAFQPILVPGKAMVLPALVCTGFNADFDGDQMAVHIPLSLAARAESWKLLYARNNLLSPATGKPILVLSQEMVLGCYFSSLILNPSHALFQSVRQSIDSKTDVIKHKKERKEPGVVKSTGSFIGKESEALSSGGLLRTAPPSVTPLVDQQQPLFYSWNKRRRHSRNNAQLYFTTMKEVTHALERGLISLQTPIWLRMPLFEDNTSLEEPLEIRLDVTGHSFRLYSESQRHFSRNEKGLNQTRSISYIRTSAGRTQLNETLSLAAFG